MEDNMTQVIGEWLAAILAWAAAIPVQGWAILLGLLGGGVVTQWLKRTVPMSVLFPSWPKQAHVALLRVSALVFAFIPTYMLWPADQYQVWAALAVGFTTPTVYRVISFFVYKRWPQMEARWSGTK